MQINYLYKLFLVIYFHLATSRWVRNVPVYLQQEACTMVGNLAVTVTVSLTCHRLTEPSFMQDANNDTKFSPGFHIRSVSRFSGVVDSRTSMKGATDEL